MTDLYVAISMLSSAVFLFWLKDLFGIVLGFIWPVSIPCSVVVILYEKYKNGDWK